MTRACSARSSTGRRARSGWRRPTPPCRPTVATCRARWCWRPPGRPGPAGWRSVTSWRSAPWHRTSDRSALHRRTPGDFDAEHVLIRSATCLHGTVDVVLDCEPSFDYGRRRRAMGVCRGSYDQVVTTNPDFIRLTLAGDLRLGIEGRAVRARHRLVEGESCYVALSWADRPPPADMDEVRAVAGRDQPLLARLGRRRPVPRSSVARAAPAQRADAEGPHLRIDRRPACRADDLAARDIPVATATGTTATPGCETRPSRSGRCTRSASTPRPTTSWPSSATCSSPRGSADGEPPVGAPLQVLYGVDGTSALPESELDHLSGYGGSRPVRVGNAAYSQEQFDILGAIVDCVYQHTRSRDSLSERSWRIVVHAVETAARSLARTRSQHLGDSGESLGTSPTPRSCAGSPPTEAPAWPRCAARPAGPTGGGTPRWRSTPTSANTASTPRDASPSRTARTSWTPRCCCCRSCASSRPQDERAPRDRARHRRGADRRRLGPPVPDRARPTTASTSPKRRFTVCSFWLVSALVEIGEIDRARKLCERLLGSASGLGLYGEELDPRTGRHLGNFPQALTHLVAGQRRSARDRGRRADEASVGPAASPSWWAAAGRDERADTKAI